MSFSPWHYVGKHHPDWVVRVTDLGGLHEVMCWGRRVILLNEGSSMIERRCQLTHAVGHIELEHRGDTFNLKEEASADRWAARMLIDVRPLARSLEWDGWQLGHQVAASLRVDVETLTNRIAHLHPSERTYLIRCRAEQEHAA